MFMRAYVYERSTFRKTAFAKTDERIRDKTEKDLDLAVNNIEVSKPRVQVETKCFGSIAAQSTSSMTMNLTSSPRR